VQTQISALFTDAAAALQNSRLNLGKAKPAGRHLAPSTPLAPLTEIAQVVATGQIQRRAAVVAAAGGMFISSFAAANLDFADVEESDAVYADATINDDAIRDLDGTEIGNTQNGEAEETDGTDAADDLEFIAAMPGWVVEATAYTQVETPETATVEGFAVVDVTPAPPPPPPPARHSRGVAVVAPPPSVAGNAVLEIAARYVGSPYRWGGNTPAGFDCSGFTTFVFGQLGINLPRTSSAQRHAGTVVPRSEAQPGDLVWWPGHVGIFAEGNTFIDAPGPGRTVQFRNMWHSNPTFIRLG